jgi:gamma-glutamylputrescine oxidase
MQLSVWEKESFLAPADLVIAGSGFVGLWCAYYLKKKHPKLRITIIERGVLPTGASTRNAGFACFGSATELLEDVNKMGTDRMLELVSMRFEGIIRIAETFKKKQIDFNICGGYDLIGNDLPVKKSEFEEKIKWLNHQLSDVIGHKKVFQFQDKKIVGFGFGNTRHLIENRLEGYLHSGKLCLGLLKLIQGMGVIVLNATTIESFEQESDGLRINTNQPFSLQAGKLLICTNAFARQLLPDLDVVPARGQVLLTAPIDNLRIKGTFHYDEGFYYFRNLGDRILLGGARNKAFEEETTTTFATTDLIQNELERFLREVVLPGTPFHITDRWSGIMAMGSEKMPIIREVFPNVHCAVRMSGMGVALAPVIGEELSKTLR